MMGFNGKPWVMIEITGIPWWFYALTMGIFVVFDGDS